MNAYAAGMPASCCGHGWRRTRYANPTSSRPFSSLDFFLGGVTRGHFHFFSALSVRHCHRLAPKLCITTLVCPYPLPVLWLWHPVTAQERNKDQDNVDTRSASRRERFFMRWVRVCALCGNAQPRKYPRVNMQTWQGDSECEESVR